MHALSQMFFRNKSKKKKSQQIDPDTLAPPELELMETGEITAMQSDAETNIMEPEPLVLQDIMDVSSDATQCAGSMAFTEGEEDEQSIQDM